jgi:hypothetical protein
MVACVFVAAVTFFFAELLLATTGDINRDTQTDGRDTPCGGGIKYLHRARASIRDDGKGTQCSGVYLGHPVPGGYKYGDLAPQVGGISRTGTIKYCLESRGTALARTSSNSKLQTRPLVRKGVTKQQTRNCLMKISRRNKNWSRVPDGCLIPRRTGRLTVGRN